MGHNVAKKNEVKTGSKLGEISNEVDGYKNCVS
jgi:hypothetical protein